MQVANNCRYGSCRELLNARHLDFFAVVRVGKYEPFVYPFESSGAFILTLCILIPHGQSVPVRYAKYLAFLIIVYLCASTIARCRSVALGNGYWIGEFSQRRGYATTFVPTMPKG